MARTGRGKARDGRVRTRRAIALLLVIAACLVALLIFLPARRDSSDLADERSGGALPGERSASRGSEAGSVQRPAPENKETAGSRRKERPRPRARIAVVIDDVGYNMEDLQPFLDFPGPLTLSVLPNLRYSEESARRVVGAGKELLLHMPMEAENGNDPGPGAILTSQEDEEIRRLLQAGFSQVPQAAGMNNHMGSRATADPRVMNIVMDYLQASGRYFLDSRTTTETLGPRIAGAHEVPYLERDIFLDNEPQAEEIRRAVESGVQAAGNDGSAILIGHVRNPQIVEVIEDLLGELDRAGVQMVFLSELLEGESP